MHIHRKKNRNRETRSWSVTLAFLESVKILPDNGQCARGNPISVIHCHNSLSSQASNQYSLPSSPLHSQPQQSPVPTFLHLRPVRCRG